MSTHYTGYLQVILPHRDGDGAHNNKNGKYRYWVCLSVPQVAPIQKSGELPSFVTVFSVVVVASESDAMITRYRNIQLSTFGTIYQSMVNRYLHVIIMSFLSFVFSFVFLVP
jgi:hypothetical protein